MKGYDYNTLLSSKHRMSHIPHTLFLTSLPVFYVSYIGTHTHHLLRHTILHIPLLNPVFELPANLFTKWFGPGKAIPLYTIIFGVLSIAMGFVKSFGSSLAVRFLLGCVGGTGDGRGMTRFADARVLQCG